MSRNKTSQRGSPLGLEGSVLLVMMAIPPEIIIIVLFLTRMKRLCNDNLQHMTRIYLIFRITWVTAHRPAIGSRKFLKIVFLLKIAMSYKMRDTYVIYQYISTIHYTVHFFRIDLRPCEEMACKELGFGWQLQAGRHFHHLCKHFHFHFHHLSSDCQQLSWSSFQVWSKFS